MNEMINNISFGDVCNLILVVASIIGLFIFRRQAVAAEKELNIKIVEVQELANRIEKESKEREILANLQVQEVLDRINSSKELWNHINFVTDKISEKEYYKKIFETNEAIDNIYVCIYLTALIRDICILYFHNQGQNFEETEVNSDIKNIFNFLANYYDFTLLEMNRNNQLFIANQNHTNKQSNYDFRKMSSSEIEKVFLVINQELADDLDEINNSYSTELDSIGSKYSKSKEELVAIVNRIITNVAQKTDSSE